ncbi:MAG: type VI secretion system baseplate subunit TssG [Desulfococcaceae bacterium]|nr:type VI secretion system baseplate subunit TssG [Desulfococcaceae bacterium]
METENRDHGPALKKELLAQGKKFSFFQAVRLLQYYERRYGESAKNPPPKGESDSLRNIINIRPDLSMHFPGTDIVSVEAPEEVTENGLPQYRITATFLGLYGISSPLPSFYTEELMEEQREDSSVSRDFIDIINSPLYPLLFECWSKYRLGIRISENESARDMERLFCLMGLGDTRVRSRVEEPESLLRYTGLFAHYPRSAPGLEALLSDAFQAPDVRIIPCIPERADIPDDQLCRLGMSGCRMGKDAYLGRRLKDRMGKFRVHMGHLDADTFQQWLPDTKNFKKMTALLRLYTDQPLKWDLEIVLTEGAVSTTRPGDSRWARLGWNTWLFSEDNRKHRTGVVFRRNRKMGI